jgi:predicted AAA+ superfamily ATPase
MLKRSIWNKLLSWKNSPHHPLILAGLRQTGKTYIVREFGKENYENVVYLDMRKEVRFHSIFEGDFDIDTMVTAITANEPSAHFVPGKTLLILDEIQDCPDARSSLKYWDIDGRYDVIATGSFLGVRGFRTPYKRGIPVGYEQRLEMYPLSFAEFLENAGMQQSVVDYVKQCFKDGTPVMKPVHERIRALYYQYIVVGGMPDAVNTFFETHDMNQVKKVQRQIIDSIRDDFGRYMTENGETKINETLKLRAEACLDSVPEQLSREYKKFKYSEVDVKGHSTEKADGLWYISDVGLVLLSYNLREISAPLEVQKLEKEFKVFYADTGLLISQLDDGTAARVLEGDLSAYKGAIAENTVACAFTAAGIPLYYYRAKSGSPELDFVFSNHGVPTLVECKSSRTSATSLKFVLTHPAKFGSHPAVKYADTNVGGGDGFSTYPLYALGFLENESDDSFVVPEVDLSNLADIISDRKNK